MMTNAEVPHWLLEPWLDRIAALMIEAGMAGDREMVETCKRALDRDLDAFETCVEVIEWATNEAAHMDIEEVRDDSTY